MRTPAEIRLGLKNREPDELMADALELIEELQAKTPQWIDVKEQSPERYQRVLLIPTTHPRVCIGNYHGEGKKGGHYFLTGNRLETAKWWMPVPEMPKEEQ